MRFEHLDLNLLSALDALLETRSVSTAAKRLHLSQPALAAALRRLRDFFEDELLVLTGRTMILTPRAEELAPRVRKVLIQIRSEILTPSSFDPATARRTFALVASDYAYSIFLGNVIAQVGAIAPGLAFEIYEPATMALEALDRAEIDLLFSVSGYRIAKHPYLPLFRDQDVTIAWRGAGYSTLDRDTFIKAGHAIARFGPDRHPSLSDHALAQQVPERRIEIVVPNFASLPQAVVGTRRLATVHRLYAEHFAASYPIKAYPTPVPLPEVIETVQWHGLRGADPGVQWLLSWVLKYCATLPPTTRLTDSSAAERAPSSRETGRRSRARRR
jgi:LysR family nod box-dependent transcriptional activator